MFLCVSICLLQPRDICWGSSPKEIVIPPFLLTWIKLAEVHMPYIYKWSMRYDQIISGVHMIEQLATCVSLWLSGQGLWRSLATHQKHIPHRMTSGITPLRCFACLDQGLWVWSSSDAMHIYDFKKPWKYIYKFTMIMIAHTPSSGCLYMQQLYHQHMLALTIVAA